APRRRAHPAPDRSRRRRGARLVDRRQRRPAGERAQLRRALTRSMRRYAAAAAAMISAALVADGAAANDGAVSTFVRGDSDATVVVSPRAAARVALGDLGTTVDAAYSADVWTSASIDVRTAATVPITAQ